MDKNRKIAIVAGVLYIIGTVAGVLSMILTQPVFTAPDFLTQVSSHQNQVILGALMVLTMGLALALVPAVLFPVLRKYNEILALGYLIFRGALETTAYFATVTIWFFLVAIGRESMASIAPAASNLQALGVVFLKGSDMAGNLLIIVFSLDALMLYTILYQSSLIPRWISVWGFIAILMHFSTTFLLMFRLAGTEIYWINIPIALQEMVMAVWFIVKGFSPTSAAPMPIETAASPAYL